MVSSQTCRPLNPLVAHGASQETRPVIFGLRSSMATRSLDCQSRSIRSTLCQLLIRLYMSRLGARMEAYLEALRRKVNRKALIRSSTDREGYASHGELGGF